MDNNYTDTDILMISLIKRGLHLGLANNYKTNLPSIFLDPRGGSDKEGWMEVLSTVTTKAIFIRPATEPKNWVICGQNSRTHTTEFKKGKQLGFDFAISNTEYMDELAKWLHGEKKQKEKKDGIVRKVRHWLSKDSAKTDLATTTTTNPPRLTLDSLSYVFVNLFRFDFIQEHQAKFLYFYHLANAAGFPEVLFIHFTDIYIGQTIWSRFGLGI